MSEKTLYHRLGGYDAISAVVHDLLPRLREDPRLAHFWQHRSEDNLKRSRQLLVDFLCSSAGGPVYYAGRDMIITHKGMRISDSHWTAFMEHVHATLQAFRIPETECDDLISFVENTKLDMVEA